MNRHTAGKWIVAGWKIGKTRNQFEMTVITGENISGTLQMQENVKLVESAHELLEACEAADWNSLDLPEHVRAKITAAIAKARGEA